MWMHSNFRRDCLVTCLFLFFSLIAAAEAVGVNYYVSPAGSDNNTGSAASPFLTIQKGADTAIAGDTVNVKDGVYTDTDNNNVVVNITRSGTASNWITFKSENKWGAVLDGQLNKTGYGFIIGPNAAYVRIEGFEVMEVSYIGIHFESNVAADNLYIYKNHIHHVGLRTRTTQGEMNNNLFGRVGIFIGAGSNGHIIDSNVLHHIGRLDDPSNWSSSRGQNQIEEYKHDHGIYIDKIVNNISVINNIFYENHHGWHVQISPGDSNIKFINNITYGANKHLIGVSGLGGAFDIWGNHSNITIQNNIFYDPTNDYVLWTWPLDGSGGISNVVVRNNLTTASRYPSPNINQGDFIYQNNLILTEPGFVNKTNYDFHHQSGSTAIDAGHETDSPPHDMDNNARSDGSPDLGAYEFLGSGLPLPPMALSISSK